MGINMSRVAHPADPIWRRGAILSGTKPASCRVGLSSKTLW